MKSNVRVQLAKDNGYKGEVLLKKIDSAIRFTKEYQKHSNSHVAVREAHELSTLYPALCADIREYDLIAGRFYHNYFVGFGLEEHISKGIEEVKLFLVITVICWDLRVNYLKPYLFRNQ